MRGIFKNLDKIFRYLLRTFVVIVGIKDNCNEMITCLCAIDGALMIDPYGFCEGIGLILPNDAPINGDSSRGARYNSARAYSSNHKNDLVCVISEDGMIDFM